MKLHQAGRLQEAARAYQGVLARDPNQADALHLLGVVRLQSGQLSEAIELIRRAADRRPDSPDILGNLGIAYSQAGQFADALTIYDRMLSRKRGDPNALIGRSMMLLHLGRGTEALEACDKALAATPHSVFFLFHRGNILTRLGRFVEAMEAMDRILALAPGDAAALNNRGSALAQLERQGEAIESYTKALAIKPDYIDALVNRANALKDCERFAEAIVDYQAVLARSPRHVEALSNCGAAFTGLHKAADALAYLDRALTLDPRNASALVNRGSALLGLGRDDEAFACVKAAVDIDPEKFDACNLLLANGEFTRGWALFDRRKNTAPAFRRGYRQPEWRGERVNGTLLVSGEQGLGDQILFLGLIPELRRKAEHLVVEVEPRLVGLVARSFPDIEVIPLDGDLYRGEIASQTLIGSTAKFLRPDWDSFADHPKSFLRADDSRVADFRSRLGGTVNIGVSWHSRKAKTGTQKSSRIIDFAPLLKLDRVRLIDLQYGDTQAERAEFAAATGHAMTHFNDLDLTNDIDGVAALVCACDLVVTVSNTTAHLAGAIGQRTWVMPPAGYARIWYWADRGQENPWYPSVEVRQQRPGQAWADVVKTIGDEIAANVVR